MHHREFCHLPFPNMILTVLQWYLFTHRECCCCANVVVSMFQMEQEVKDFYLGIFVVHMCLSFDCSEPCISSQMHKERVTLVGYGNW